MPNRTVGRRRGPASRVEIKASPEFIAVRERLLGLIWI